MERAPILSTLIVISMLSAMVTYDSGLTWVLTSVTFTLAYVSLVNILADYSKLEYGTYIAMHFVGMIPLFIPWFFLAAFTEHPVYYSQAELSLLASIMVYIGCICFWFL